MVDLGEQLHVTGKALKVRFRAETGFTILSADIQNQQSRDVDATLVGMMPPIDAGDPFEAELIVQEHPEYGYQYKVVNLFLKDDTADMTEEGIAAYLEAKVSGVGPKLSKRIVDFFGQQTFEVIELEPEKLLQVPGVTRSTIMKVQASWDERHGERKLITGLQSLGLSIAQAQRAVKQFGSMALEVLKNDIYALTEVEGIGFQTADRLALAEFVSTEKNQRVCFVRFVHERKIIRLAPMTVPHGMSQVGIHGVADRRTYFFHPVIGILRLRGGRVRILSTGCKPYRDMHKGVTTGCRTCGR